MRHIISAKILVNLLLYTLRGIFLYYSIIIFFLIYNLISSSIDGGAGYTNLPVIFKTTRIGNLNIENGPVNSWFYISGNGYIHTDSIPQNVFYMSTVYNLLSSAIILLIIHLICKMLINARKGNFLLYDNAIVLRNIALLNIVSLFLGKLFLVLSQLYLMDKMEFPNIEFGNPFSLSFPPWKQISL